MEKKNKLTSQSMIDLRSINNFKTTNAVRNKKLLSENVIDLLNSFENLPENKNSVVDFVETLIKNGKSIQFIEGKNDENKYAATILLKDFLIFQGLGLTKTNAIYNAKQSFFNFIKSLQKLIVCFKKRMLTLN